MSLLTIIQNFCRRQNVPVPATVYGTTDPQILQVMALLEEEGNDLSGRGSWEGITFEATLSTLAAEDQGAMATIASNGYRYIKNGSIWDRTTRLPVNGPVDANDWQAIKALAITGPRYQYRIRGGKLLATPNPPAGNDWRFEYVSHNWILGANGVTYKQYFTLDTDTMLLPEALLMMGLRWRWLREKGQDYSELFRTYEIQVNAALSRDGAKKTLNMGDAASRAPLPGVFVSPGNWI